MRVVWSAPAVADLEAIWDYVALDSPQNARDLVRRLLDAVAHLEHFPAMGRAVPEDPRGTGRELVVVSYRVLYEVGSETVEILGVVHARRDLGRGVPPWEHLD